MMKLPNEIIAEIVYQMFHISDWYDHDFQNLRLASRIFHPAANECFFEIFTVRTTRKSLQNLVEMSEHATISKNVKSVVFSPGYIIETPKSTFKYAWDQAHPETTFERSDEREQAWQEYQKALEEQLSVRADCLELKAFTYAFARLRGLNQITAGANDPHYDRAPIYGAVKVPLDVTANNQAVKVFFDCLVISKLELDALNVLYPEIDMISTSGQNLCNLIPLSRSSKEIYLATFGELSHRCTHGLEKFLARLLSEGRQLEILKLELLRKNWTQPGLCLDRITIGLRLPKLRDLTISYMCFSEARFRSFCTSHQLTLEKLRLSCCVLTDFTLPKLCEFVKETMKVGDFTLYGVILELEAKGMTTYSGLEFHDGRGLVVETIEDAVRNYMLNRSLSLDVDRNYHEFRQGRLRHVPEHEATSEQLEFWGVKPQDHADDFFSFIF